jgi:hypothetical protein
MPEHRARPDLGAYDRATRLSFSEAVAELNEVLGPKLVAYIGGVTDTRAARDWAARRREARPMVEQRLRTALRIALLLRDHDDPKVVQAWFQGLNPQLDDQVPARLLREGDIAQAGRNVLAAARAFVVGG